jgi:ArsR family transcriptional regulator, arsenate/arsenite/antimonite-responsive transcriptional repressor
MAESISSLVPRKRGARASVEVPFSSAEIQRLSEDLGLLSNPIRLRLLTILLEREGWVCVCDLVKGLGLKQPTVSHHLKLLKDAGLVDDERRGIWSHYFVNRDRLEELKTRIASAMERMA